MSRATRNGGLVVAIVALGALIFWLARGEGGDGAAAGSRAPAASSEAELPSFAADGAAAPAATPVVVAAVGEPAPTASLSATRLIVHVTWAADASPAPDIRLKLIAFDRPDPLHHIQLGRTDAQGTWTVDPAPLGQVVVYSDRGGSVKGIVKEGETLELSLALAPGTLLTGIVVDPDERPVAGAEIWLSDYGNHTHGTIVAQSGADGRFALRGVEPYRYLGARAAGHTPSSLATVDNEAPAAMDVRLQVGGPGAAIHGLVLNADGAPVPGAYVMVGPEHGWPGPNPHIVGDGPPPLELRTAPDGTFLAANLPPGTTPVAVKADGWTPWRGWAMVAADQTAELRAELKRAASIAGTVHDESGAPVAGVSLTTGSDYGETEWSETQSDANGHFVLRDVALGEQQVVASKKDLGEDKHGFVVEEGQSYAWDPVLSTGARIVGGVIDESGEPVEGLWVQADSDAPNGTGRQTKVEADGRFVLSNCDAPPYLVSVFTQDWTPPPLLAVGDVRPGPDELRLVIPAGARNVATVTGRLAGAHAQPVGKADVMVMAEEANFGMAGHADPETGEFSVGGLRAGSYVLSVEAKGWHQVRVPVKDLRPGEHRDVGKLVMPASGTVVVSLQLAPGLDAKEVDCILHATDGSHGGWSFDGRKEGLLERRSEPLAPGDYFVEGLGSHVLNVRMPVTIVADKEAHVNLALEKGVHLQMDFLMPDSAAHRVEAWITDAAGVEVLDQTADAAARTDEKPSRGVIVVVLRPGHYGLRVALDGNDSLQTVFDVPSGSDNAKRQEFKLP